MHKQIKSVYNKIDDAGNNLLSENDDVIKTSDLLPLLRSISGQAHNMVATCTMDTAEGQERF